MSQRANLAWAKLAQNKTEAFVREIDKHLNKGKQSGICIGGINKVSDAEPVAQAYRERGWTVAYSPSLGYSGGFIFNLAKP